MCMLNFKSLWHREVCLNWLKRTILAPKLLKKAISDILHGHKDSKRCQIWHKNLPRILAWLHKISCSQQRRNYRNCSIDVKFFMDILGTLAFCMPNFKSPRYQEFFCFVKGIIHMIYDKRLLLTIIDYYWLLLTIIDYYWLLLTIIDDYWVNLF